MHAVRVRCRLFARYAEVTGEEEVEVEVPAPATVADALAALRARLAHGDRLPERPLVARNRVHALLTDPIADGDELALLPPLAGG
jgi:molybdopterin converting factor small subunit